jgi:hypothetical protein
LVEKLGERYEVTRTKSRNGRYDDLRLRRRLKPLQALVTPHIPMLIRCKRYQFASPPAKAKAVDNRAMAERQNI